MSAAERVCRRYRRDLLAILRRIRACATQDDDHRALDAVHAFLRQRVSTERYANASAGGRWYTRLFGGEGRLDLANWLAELRLGRREWNLEVISPYFDSHGAAPLKKLIEVVKPRETRVHLPRDADGSALVTAHAYEAATALDGVRWAELPDEITRRSGGASGERLAPRRVHAKVYRVWREKRRGGGDVVLVGSVNCTSPAHRHGSTGNLEAAFLVDISDQVLPRRWWLEPLERDAERFAEAAPDEADGLDRPPFGVSICFHWGQGTLAVRLESEMAFPIEVEEVSGRRLFAIERSDAERWCVCDENAADAVRESLASSNFVVMRHGDARWRVLVREEGMAHRPSILSELSPDEILEYWSLLSAEERAAFFERHAAFGEEIEGIPAAEKDSLAAGDTLFDRFAGLFHAFGCLRRNIEKALADGRHEEAEIRLLGAKYDSLPELLRKTLEREDGDPVLGYVTFLTAKQLRDSLTKRDRRFFQVRKPLVRKLDQLIATGIERRHVPNRTREGFRDAFAVALNGAVPEADLVIVDEAHNLKHGFRAAGSTRNRVMGLAFGHPDGDTFGQPWFTKKAKRVLLLSATRSRTTTPTSSVSSRSSASVTPYWRAGAAKPASVSRLSRIPRSPRTRSDGSPNASSFAASRGSTSRAGFTPRTCTGASGDAAGSSTMTNRSRSRIPGSDWSWP